MTVKQIVRRSFSPDHADSFSDVPPILRRIFAARQVASPTELDHDLKRLHPFSLLKDIDKAVALLYEALQQRQPIIIVGDFDADGATSTAVAVRALRLYGAHHVSFLVPNRFAFGYGLTKELVDIAKADKPYLIVTVDNGIANHAGVSAAKSAGIKVLITDHHLSPPVLPEADAIVNPNQPHDYFPSKCLAGVGVIFYVMLALRRHLVNVNWFEIKNLPAPNLSQLLDIVALGTIADIVPLDHNNRILVHHGLRRIRAGQCTPGMMALLEISGRNYSRVTSSDLGFAVGARLNAAGRIDDMSLGIECLLTDDPFKARDIARTLNTLNESRKSIEGTMKKEALTTITEMYGKLGDELPKGLCLFDDNWHQGVIGILAARIKERFNRPVIVFAPSQNSELKGSARSIEGFHVRDALAHLDAHFPKLIKKFGGHAMAAGLTIARDDFNEFNERFNHIASSQLSDDALRHLLYSDGELCTDELSLQTAQALRQAGPWGQAFPEPLFDDCFKILEQHIVGDKHLKLTLQKQNQVISAILFFVDLEQWPDHRCHTVRAAYRLDINEYKGQQRVQLIIEYMEKQ